MEYLKEFWKDPLNVEGKCSRKEFINVYGLSFIFSFIPIIGLIYGLVAAIPLFCLAVRRFHDLGCSGKWVITLIIPFINIGMIIYLLVGNGGKEYKPKTVYNNYNSPTINNNFNSPIINNDSIEKDLLDILQEDTIYVEQEPQIPNNIFYESKVNQNNANCTTTNNEAEKENSDILKVDNTYAEQQMNTEINVQERIDKINNQDNSLVLYSIVFCILGMLFFRWPVCIVWEIVSIILAGLSIYEEYNNSREISIIAVMCIVFSILLLFIICTY